MTGRSSVEVEPGAFLLFNAGEVDNHDRRVRFRLAQMRWDLSTYYAGRKVWLEGHLVDAFGAPEGRLSILVLTAAIPAAILRASPGARRATSPDR